MSAVSLAKTIDHALLRPELTLAEVSSGCELARHYGVFSVCVKPCHIQFAREELLGSGVQIGTVIGFPHGGQTSRAKAFETADAIDCGADELDMVLNIAALRAGAEEYVRREIEEVVDVAGRRIVKVILETALLSDQEIRLACQISEQSGARFVKTSTGFASQGATVEHVRLMRDTVGAAVQIKASGGIRTLSNAEAMLAAGASRLGTTATASILSGVSLATEASY